MEEEKKQQGKRKEHKKSWQEVYASIDDIKRFLLEHVMLRYNVITKQTEVHVIEQKLSAVILGRAFVALGYRYVTIKGSRHYLVVRRTADEMRVMRQTAGGGDGGDGGAVF